MKRILMAIGACILIAVLIFSVLQLINYYADEVRNKSQFEDLAKLTEVSSQAKAITSSEKSSQPDQLFSEASREESSQESVPAGRNLKALKEKNPDFLGWISIENTTINYPVVQRKNDAEYYLKRNFYTEKSDFGIPFLDFRCEIRSSKNQIIYAHHMNDGSMFSDLIKFKDKIYWESRKTIQFETEQGMQKYEIFAVTMQNGVVKEKEQSLYQMIDFVDEKEFDAAMKFIDSQKIYDTGVKPAFGDQWMTLSTCEYSENNGRISVIGRRKG